MFRISHHVKKLFAVLYFGAGNTFIGIKAHKVVPRALCVLREEFFLCFQAVELVFFVGGDPAICGDVHGKNLSVISKSHCYIYYSILFNKKRQEFSPAFHLLNINLVASHKRIKVALINTNIMHYRINSYC